jgi:hypothetical protein
MKFSAIIGAKRMRRLNYGKPRSPTLQLLFRMMMQQSVFKYGCDSSQRSSNSF